MCDRPVLLLRALGLLWQSEADMLCVCRPQVIKSLISTAPAAAGQLGRNGTIYFLLTGPNINQNLGSAGSFCNDYCGWHDFYYQGSGATAVKVKYLWAGEGSTCGQLLPRSALLSQK
jgi:hypothetical protein